MNKLEQAMEDHKQGKWQKADKAYLEMLQEEPENMDLLYILATSQMSQNKLDQALTTINKAIKIEGVSSAFHQTKGSILARMGKIDEAKVELETALKSNPNLYQSHIVLGHIFYTKGITKEARKHFEMAIKIDPKLPEGQVNLAKLLLDEGEVDEAINRLRTIEKEHPEQASVKLMMGQAFIENGAYSYAENYFQKVLAMHPDYGLAGLYLGITKLHTGDMKNAEKLIVTFNQQYPNTREGIAAAGLLNFRNDRFGAAVEYLKKAIGTGLSPLSWRAAFVESLERMGTRQPAVDFYKKLAKNFGSKAAEFRLGELYEKQSKITKAKKQYKKIQKDNSKYIAALLGLARIYLLEKKPESSEKISQKVLEKTSKHAEATLLLLTSLLFQNKTEQALVILNELNYDDYKEVYKKTFRLQHGLILDNQKKYNKAMEVFLDTSKLKQQEVPKVQKLVESEIKTIQNFNSKTDDDQVDPIFVIGAQSTGVNDFALWLNKQGVKVLNDRLVSLGRPDILYSYLDVDSINKVDDEMVKLERKLYHQKVQVLTNGTEGEGSVVDCMYINPNQMALVKKFFPKAQIVLLNRDSADIWLNQKVYGQEPVSSAEWNETVNQIISMNLNIMQIDFDLWQQNDEETIEKLSQIFNKELNNKEGIDRMYWRKAHFKKGHWKNYKEFLGT